MHAVRVIVAYSAAKLSMASISSRISAFKARLFLTAMVIIGAH